MMKKESTCKPGWIILDFSRHSIVEKFTNKIETKKKNILKTIR